MDLCVFPVSEFSRITCRIKLMLIPIYHHNAFKVHVKSKTPLYVLTACLG